ncbi:ATP-binding cassette domain-containing protein [Fulvivirga sp. 29W222]|uniref:ATP-binding cassette domain-containing protein n=1 Tax=Fulvivirga marina TaxID=2494733 RepID=A0A937FVH7_9BACT|nr:ATP-binding cassette domain-containing protein [Fulvivirga marina]MBL6446804.1 ATP-binding cassette domain-containing protein [Fulvivirga marina]
MEALIAKNITKRYSNHTALDNVSLSIPSQSIFGLLGPNGAGKTTMIRIINQIIDADEGEVLINGKKLSPEHISIIGYLPEERGLYKKMKVGEQLVYLGQLRNLTRKEAILRSKAWTKKLGIYEWWDKKVEDLSKGMAQKIQFISTVLHEPKLIILDEPFSGFDPVNANLIKEEIFELRDKGSTIIFSTHRMESVEELCDHIALINNSKLILEGSKKDIKHSYKSNTYIVEHQGALNGSLPDSFKVLDNNLLHENFYKSIVKIAGETSPNELLKSLVAVTEVHSFVEKIPSISEIFISKVGGNK